MLLTKPCLRVKSFLRTSLFNKPCSRIVLSTELRNHLQLAWRMSRQDLLNRYAGSYAGVAWTIGVPLIYAVINTVVFSTLMSNRMGTYYGDVPFVLFYFIPFSIWIFFNEIVGRSTSIIGDYKYLISKIAFPLWILPLIPLASALLSQIIVLLLAFGLMYYNGVNLGQQAPAYLAVWFIVTLLALGLAYFCSALAVYIPDLSQVIPVFLNIIFWLTPILYPATLVRDQGTPLLQSIVMEWNPFYYLVEASRHAFFDSAPIQWVPLSIIFVLALMLCISGLGIFRKLKPGFADVL